jgi:hypothetical protein
MPRPGEGNKDGQRGCSLSRCGGNPRRPPRIAKLPACAPHPSTSRWRACQGWSAARAPGRPRTLASTAHRPPRATSGWITALQSDASCAAAASVPAAAPAAPVPGRGGGPGRPSKETVGKINAQLSNFLTANVRDRGQPNGSSDGQSGDTLRWRQQRDAHRAGRARRARRARCARRARRARLPRHPRHARCERSAGP